MATKDTEKEAKALQEIFEDKRYFVMEDGSKFYIEPPSADEIRMADWHYSKTYNQAFLAGVTTLAQMQEILEDRQIIGREYEERKTELQDILNKKILALRDAEDVVTKKELADQVESARTALFRHNQKASSPLSNTCEQLAEDARIEHLASSMITDDAGKRVWTDYDSYKTTNKPGLGMRARYEVMLYLQGLQSDFLDQTPEAVARREIQEVETIKQIEQSSSEEVVNKKLQNDSKKKKSPK